MPTSIIHWGRHRDAKRYNYLLSYSKISKGFRYRQVFGKWATHRISSRMAIYLSPNLRSRKGWNIQCHRLRPKMPALSNPRYERFAQALFAGLAARPVSIAPNQQPISQPIPTAV